MATISESGEQAMADMVERALEFSLISFGMGVASVSEDIVIDIDVVSRLKSRYRAGMGEYLLKHVVEFDDTLRKYLTKRGRQIGSKAARMVGEFRRPSIDGNLFDDAAVGVEAEIQKLKTKYETIYTKKLDVLCGL